MNPVLNDRLKWISVTMKELRNQLVSASEWISMGSKEEIYENRYADDFIKEMLQLMESYTWDLDNLVFNGENNEAA